MARSSVCVERVVGLEPGLVVVTAADQGRREPGVAVSENHVRLFEAHGRRIGNGEGGVVKGQGALQAALPRIADGAIHRAAQLQLGRELRAHMARQFQDRRDGKAIPVHGDGPMRLRKVIGSAEMYRQGEGRVACRRSNAIRAAGRSGPGVRGCPAANPDRCPASCPSDARRRYPDGP